MGEDAAAVGREVARRRSAGQRVAGFVGSDRALAATMGEEMLGGLDDLVVLAANVPTGRGGGLVRCERPDTGR